MPIDADKVRELIARGESTTLDFKRDDYNWAADASNAELAKDIMAIANLLRANAEAGFILVGVANDGTLNGVPVAAHLDDAVLHQKVQSKLNKTPSFAYYPVQVDGASIGVFEIAPGGRPFFPLRDSGNVLRRHVALYRNGTSTDVASPTMILEWGREDDARAHRLRDLELRKLEAEIQVHGRVRQHLSTPRGITLHVENMGSSGFWIERVAWRVEWNAEFAAVLAEQHISSLPAGYVHPHSELPEPQTHIIPSRAVASLEFEWPIEHLEMNIARHFGLPRCEITWADFCFEIYCRGQLGGEGIVHYAFRPDPPPTTLGGYAFSRRR